MKPLTWVPLENSHAYYQPSSSYRILIILFNSLRGVFFALQENTKLEEIAQFEMFWLKGTSFGVLQMSETKFNTLAK